MTKGLMDRSLHHEMALERVREKAKLAEEELFEIGRASCRERV